MKKTIVTLLLLCLSGFALAESMPLELIRGTTTRPWPGRNYPELPSLPDPVISNIVAEIESAPTIRKAYSKLNAATQGNVAWFEGLAELKKQKAMWSLLSCLCHPHDDVQVYALRALARLKDERSLSFLLQYASAMAVHEGGSENATLHGIIHDETAKALSAITGLQFKKRRGQDPEGLKAAIAASTTWWLNKTGKVPTKDSTLSSEGAPSDEK